MNTSGGETILVAEDEPLVRDLIVTALEMCGYRVLAAANGEEALEIFTHQSEAIDLILTDAIMPKFGGHHLFEEVRQRRPDMRFLFITGYGDDVLENYLFRNENMKLLTKPFGPLELLGNVHEVLQQ